MFSDFYCVRFFSVSSASETSLIKTSETFVVYSVSLIDFFFNDIPQNKQKRPFPRHLLLKTSEIFLWYNYSVSIIGV